MDNNNLNNEYENNGPIFDGQTLPTQEEINQYEQEQAESKKNKKNKRQKEANPALTALLCGVIFSIVNSIMCCITAMGSGFLFGGIFIIFPIAGIVNAFQGMKLEGSKKVQSIIGLILSIIGALEALILIILGIVGKFLA